jgi:uncharacterized repeat protein (TIGR01451 family)
MVVRISIFMLGVALAGCLQHSDGRPHISSDGADVVVTTVGPAPRIVSGRSADFTIKVANAGPNDALDVRIIDTVGRQSKLVSITCQAAGGSICPSPVGLSMVVPKLPSGGSLSFLVTLKLADSPTGTIVNSMVATYDRDSDPNNNSVTADAVVR